MSAGVVFFPAELLVVVVCVNEIARKSCRPSCLPTLTLTLLDSQQIAWVVLEHRRCVVRRRLHHHTNSHQQKYNYARTKVNM
jgi:hypothetical protein